VELAHAGLLPFRNDLHAAVAAILDPTADPKAPRLPLGSGTEIHTLDPAAYDDVKLFQSHSSLGFS